MPTSREAVANRYGKIADYEKTRLATHPMERELTLRAIRHALNTSETANTERKRIADVGGGPGKIAFALADQGHHVDLIDLTPDLIHLAEIEQDQRSESVEKPSLLASISVGDALEAIPLTNDSYDAVLLLGPLYHLLEESERKQAVENALRLAKPQGGLVFCAFVSKEAHLRDIAMRDPAKLVKQKDFYAAYLANGRYERLNENLEAEVQSFHTDSGSIREFFQHHFADVAELVSLRATEGILGGGLDAKLIDADSEVIEAWADLLFKDYSEKEEYLGCADHLLAVLRKK
ncbi:s-adenosyl-L-methionine-dependent methyltransferase [Fusarium pseudoanthophilum]|uniref:S-adenosyl-L-methionine-dependent methyltransferase n=1 Tax=Fusarium pseudoanthophilum TaxID=48495 RepID=A0A8H5UU66_9HYPO|nr:s-adenosyl-L-methionine-dependent methyltransferase [Fusarium pseudoanthophilum]